MKNIHESVVLHRWKRKDLEYVADSIAREGWGHSIRDVERCWSLEPRGCFLAAIHGVPIGHVFSVSYGELGWIGLLIVDPKARSRGVGSILMEVAVNYLQQVGCKSIRLDAVEEAVPLYKRLGFREEFDSLRFRGQLRAMVGSGRLTSGIRKMREIDLVNVARFDAHYFGADRLRILRSLLVDNPGLCYVAEEDGKMGGYIMARRVEDGFWLGPWVCENFEQGGDLFDVLAEAISDPGAVLRVGLPVVNVKARKLLEQLGFQLTGKSVRMILGNVEQSHEDATSVYGIGGPEKG